MPDTRRTRRGGRQRAEKDNCQHRALGARDRQWTGRGWMDVWVELGAQSPGSVDRAADDKGQRRWSDAEWWRWPVEPRIANAWCRVRGAAEPSSGARPGAPTPSLVTFVARSVVHSSIGAHCEAAPGIPVWVLLPRRRARNVTGRWASHSRRVLFHNKHHRATDPRNRLHCQSMPPHRARARDTKHGRSHCAPPPAPRSTPTASPPRPAITGEEEHTRPVGSSDGGRECGAEFGKFTTGNSHRRARCDWMRTTSADTVPRSPPAICVGIDSGGNAGSSASAFAGRLETRHCSVN